LRKLIETSTVITISKKTSFVRTIVIIHERENE